MRQAVSNKLQTLIKHEKTRNERRATVSEKQEQRDKKLIKNIKRAM
jgi:hypothetical protein